MLVVSKTTRFDRDVKACAKRHWDMEAFKRAIVDLMSSDEKPLGDRYRDYALTGPLQGYRSLHVDSSPNPPKDQWVIMYRIASSELTLVRTGSHEIYGR